MEVVPRNASHLNFEEVNEQFNAEFLTALQTAIGQMSENGVRISSLPSKSMELSKYMASVLDADWTQARGLDISSVGIASISYDDESKALINMRNQGAMMSDPTVREGYVQSSIAKGMQLPAPTPPVPVRHLWQWAWACRSRRIYVQRLCHQCPANADAAAGCTTGSTGCCCAGKRLDLFLRRNQHGEVLHQLRFPETGYEASVPL